MLAVAGPASGEFDPEHGRGARGTVTVVGSASTWLLPDRVAIELSVEARALTPLAAYDDLVGRVHRVQRIAMVGPVHHSAPGASALDFARASSQESASIPVVPGDGIRLEASVEVVFALE